MRRFPVVVSILLLTVALSVLVGCGGHSTPSTTGVPASIQLTPATLSLDLGPAGLGNTAAVSATVLDSNGNVATANVPATISFKSSNPAIAGITGGGTPNRGSISGVVCGGAWDANVPPVVCNPGQVGTAQIFATGGGLTSNPVTVYVHPRVDTIVVTPTLVNCKSQGQTQQMTARAFSNGADVTSSVGPFTWTPQTANVVTVNNAVNGLLTAQNPGATSIVAQLTGTTINSSLPATFVTCPLRSLTMHVQGASDTSATIAAGGSQALVYDAVDTLGAPLTGLTLSVASLNPAVGTATVSSTTANTATATGVAPGTTALVPMCLSPSCNANLPLQYGNVFTLTVSGASTPVVYAASTTGTSLVPITTSASPPTVGTAITLPSQPNSMLFAPGGAKLFLGSDTNGRMVVDTPSNTVGSPATGLTGKVLAAAPDGNRFVITEPATGKVFVDDITASAVTLPIPGATGAAFSPDGSILYIVAGSTLYVFTPNTTLKSFALGSTANNVAAITPGWFMYIAGAGSITARATCDNSSAGSVAAANPSMITSLPNGTAVIAADSPNLDVVRVNSTGAGCPPAASNALTTVGVGETFTARQIIPLPNSSKVYITSNVGLFVYDTGANTVSKIALAGDAIPFTGGATLDSATVYVGASDNAVHAISVANDTDTLQIPLTFTPDLVGVTPR